MKNQNKASIVETYHHLVENIITIKNSVRNLSRENLSMKLEYAKTKIHDMEKIGKRDLDLVNKHIHKDFATASSQFNETRKDFKQWLKKDIELTEHRLKHLFGKVVDQSRVELHQIENQLHEWHSGEMCNIGTLECKNCGEKIIFSETKIIDNCPKCNGELFHKDFDFN